MACPTGNERESLLALGKALMVAGRSRDATRAFERSISLVRNAQDDLVSDALDLLSWIAFTELDGPSVTSYGLRMLDVNVPDTSAAAFRLFVRQATGALQMGDAANALQIVERAEHVSRDADIESFTAYLAVKADIYSALGKSEAALSHARLAADLAAKRSDAYSLWRCNMYLGYTLYSAGHFEESLAAYERAHAVSSEAKLTWEIGMSRARSAWVAFLLGCMEKAREHIEIAFSCTAKQRWMTVNRAWVAMRIAAACSDTELLARSADERYLHIALDSRDSYTVGPAVAAFAAYYRTRGRVDDANALMARGITMVPSANCAWDVFPAVARNGDPGTRARAEELLRAFPSPHRVGDAHRRFFSAILFARDGDTAAAEKNAGEAQLLFEDCGCAFYAAQCMALGGRKTEAHRAFALMGAAHEASLLRTARARRGRPRGSYEMSRQRREVLGCLRRGETNARIAQRLGVSVRTIKNRVFEIYASHGVSSRAALLSLFEP
ncbi:MAG TPA: LuxR C-terminal-related transcriptional regulator [Candidatus Baltobacteraceae bacterium]|nr:LuxR C-terminal-related transcriptional regulator [Candidatus Baltobacteraceae bacterium]